MNQHVPGTGVDTPERPLDEQANILTKKLVGHQIFARMRGKVVGYPMWDLLDPESQTSPSRSLKEFDAFMSDVRVMRNLIVWLRWHGCRRAAEEVARALEQEEYRIWCEEVPFDASVPGVLLMFEPKEMLPLAKWWSKKESHYDLFLAWNDDFRRKRGDRDFEPSKIGADTEKYLRRFPFLRGSNHSERDLFLTLRKDIVNPILGQATESVWSMFNPPDMSFCGKQYPLYTGEVNEVNDRDGYVCGAFAYFFPHKEQDEILSWFPREAQKHLATWQLRIPEQRLRGTVQFHIGLYPESEHALWQKLYPSTTSKGFAAGFGALLSPRDEFKSEERIVLRSR